MHTLAASTTTARQISSSLRHCRLIPALVLSMAGAESAAQNDALASRGEQLLHIQSAIESGDLSTAESSARKALLRFPHDGGVENLLGVVHVQQGNTDAAQLDFSNAIAHSPKLLPAYLNLGRLLLTRPGAGRSDEQKAYELYLRALRLDPANAEARVEAATIDTRLARYGSSLSLVAPLAGEMQGRLEVEDLLLADNAALHNREEAETAAEAVASSPDFSEQDLNLVTPGLRFGRRADLIVRLLTAISQRHPLDASELRLLGLAKEAEGDPAAARAALEHAFAAQPAAISVPAMSIPATSILVDLARIAAAQGDGKASLGYLAHARDLAPKDAALAYQFGMTCYKLNLLGESRKAFADAYALAPENPEYALTLGKITALSQDPLKGEPFVMKYHQLKPADAQGLLLLGLIYYRVKDYPSAAEWLTKAAAHPETAAAAHLYLGSGLREQGQTQEARRELQLSEKLDGKVAEVHAQLGLVALQLKEFPEAERELAMAIQADPDSYTGNFGLVQLYAQTHDARRAAQLQRFDQIKEHNEELNREAMRVIEIDPSSAAAGEKRP